MKVHRVTAKAVKLCSDYQILGRRNRGADLLERNRLSKKNRLLERDRRQRRNRSSGRNIKADNNHKTEYQLNNNDTDSRQCQ